MYAVKGPDSCSCTKTGRADASVSREEWLNQLMLSHEKAVLRLCLMYLHDVQLAQDAVQDTFLKAYRKMDGFRGEASEKTWLMRIAVNTCRDMTRGGWFRHVDKATAIEDLPLPVAPPSAEHIALTAAILSLPAKQREVVLLHCDQGLTIRDTARALGITPPTVMNRLKKARAALASALGEEDA
ncbi:MAG: sigma-70 family RNA polymerase sigma factor [Clostridia bacterium]|nr:sigma-70 family RNA polymerase sigma factor [Clostridia bacterium]